MPTVIATACCKRGLDFTRIAAGASAKASQSGSAPREAGGWPRSSVLANAGRGGRNRRSCEYVEQEFPGLSGQIPQGVDRRNLLKVMAASLAMAGAAACTKQPKELIVPYVRQPENVIPGVPLFYATAMPTGGYARGLLVESHLNRPTKVEGNPDHPASLGATTIFEQASILNLYDPDRSETVLHEGRMSTWGEFHRRLQHGGPGARDAQRRGPGDSDRTDHFADVHHQMKTLAGADAVGQVVRSRAVCESGDRQRGEERSQVAMLLSPMIFRRPT